MREDYLLSESSYKKYVYYSFYEPLYSVEKMSILKYSEQIMMSYRR